MPPFFFSTPPPQPQQKSREIGKESQAASQQATVSLLADLQPHRPMESLLRLLLQGRPMWHQVFVWSCTKQIFGVTLVSKVIIIKWFWHHFHQEINKVIAFKGV